MAVIITTSATNGYWLYMTGTIAEVLNELADQGFVGRNLVSWSDDGTDAKALICRR
jgi:hypothetical protein